MPSRLAPIDELTKLVRHYFAYLDGESQVERDLGIMTEELEEHPNLGDAGLNDLLMVRYHIKDRSRFLEAGSTALGVEKPTAFFEWVRAALARQVRRPLGVLS